MRIRKRQVPFPLASLSPVPLSDPHFSRSPVVQLQLFNNNNNLHDTLLKEEDDTAAYFNPQSSDQPNQPTGGGFRAHHVDAKKEPATDCPKDEIVDGERSNDTRRGSLSGAETETVILQQSYTSHQVVGRWYDGEKAFPLKKRRGSFERSKEDTAVVVVSKEKKMKTKMNKKCLQRNGNTNNQEVQEEIKEIKEGVGSGSASNIKKRGRGGALMEGSRCSRVNGRGWRCCQQTLVGYSLCEHHLGKGRLRSMTSVRSRSMANAAPKKAVLPTKPLGTTCSLSSSEDIHEQKHMLLADNNNHDGEDREEGDDKKTVMISKKKMKLGTVKARSISSLLG